MEKALQTVLDFVEGRISGKDFEQLLYHDPAIETLLEDENLRWHKTYIKTNPYYFLIGLDYDDLGDVLNAQGAMELFLQTKGITFDRTPTYSNFYDLLLRVQPGWLALDSSFFQKSVLSEAGDRTGKDLDEWLRAKIKEVFRYYKKPPKWIQSPAWPITDNGPMNFLGQIKLQNCELFHDEAAVYVFIDPNSGETRTVIQVY